VKKWHQASNFANVYWRSVRNYNGKTNQLSSKHHERNFIKRSFKGIAVTDIDMEEQSEKNKWDVIDCHPSYFDDQVRVCKHTKKHTHARARARTYTYTHTHTHTHTHTRARARAHSLSLSLYVCVCVCVCVCTYQSETKENVQSWQLKFRAQNVPWRRAL